MQLSDNGLAFITSFEGKLKKLPNGKYQAYQCQAGVWTIYVGCTAGVTEGMVIDEAQGRQMLRAELAKHEVAVAKAVKGPVSQDQYDALVSFSYNCGISSMQRVAGVLNKDGAKAAAAKLMEFCKFKNPKTGQHEVSRGLLRRRSAEAKLLEPTDTEIGTMPQKVEAPPSKMTVKEAAVKVGAPVVAAAEAARQTLPSVPDSITNSVANAEKWKSTGTAAVKLGSEAWGIVSAFPLFAVLGVMCVGLYFVFRGNDAKPE